MILAFPAQVRAAVRLFVADAHRDPVAHHPLQVATLDALCVLISMRCRGKVPYCTSCATFPRSSTPRSSSSPSGDSRCSMCADKYILALGGYKIFFCFEAFVHESSIPLIPRPPIVHTIAILLHDYCARYDPPSELSFVCHIPYNIGDGNIL